MGIFGPDKKPRITKREFAEELNTALYNKGFEERERNQVEMIFHGALYEKSEYEEGIQEEEVDRAIAWLRANMQKHHLSESQIAILEQECRGLL